jgi:hypothetical protein
MYESSIIIRMNIQHYQVLLKLLGADDERRSTVVKLLADAQAVFPLAVAAEADRRS